MLFCSTLKMLSCSSVYCFKESSLRPMSCDVVVVGGGISGMYMAETLMRMKKEDSVCLFEKDTRFGGRNYDYRFKQAPNISIGRLVFVTQKHDILVCLFSAVELSSGLDISLHFSFLISLRILSSNFVVVFVSVAV